MGKNRVFVWLLMVIILNMSCSKNVPEAPEPYIEKNIEAKRRILPSISMKGPPEQVKIEELPEVPVVAKKPLPAIKVVDLYSFNILDMPVSLAFERIKETVETFGDKDSPPINFVVDPNANGKVNLTIDKLPIEKVVELICSQTGLECEKEKGRNLYYIKRPRLIQKVYRLNEAISQVSGQSSSQISSSLPMTSSVGSLSPSSQGGGGASKGRSNESSEFLSEIGKQLDTLFQQANLYKEKDLAAQYFTMNRATGLLMVWGYRSTIAQVDMFMDQILYVRNRQVRVQIQILEVALNEGNKMGIDWYRYNIAGKSGAGRGIISPTLDGIKGTITAPFAANVGKNVTGNALNITLDSTQAEAIISALANETSSEIVSTPNIVVQNNVTGSIKVTRRRNSIIIPKTNTIASGSNVIQQSAAPITKPYDEGLVVDITPFIGDDQVVTMELTQTITDLAELHTEKDADGVTLVQEPEMNERTLYTKIRVPSGKSLLMAGIQRKKTNDISSGIPVLKDLPLIGWLFGAKEKSHERSELVMMITPTIVEGDGFKEAVSVNESFENDHETMSNNYNLLGVL